ncbi:MAG: chemotaxis-specific protein-glutamate methyltransferase CheB [Planctomycetota bacterium]
MPFRIAIVNDLAMAREALRRVVLQLPDVTVAWMANDGAEAVERAKADRPDLVLMDLIMPVMDGVESIRLIMRDAPCPILVVTATVEGNASRVYEAIGAGALDAVDTPRLGSNGTHGDKALLAKIAAVRRLTAADFKAVAARAPASSAHHAGSHHGSSHAGSPASKTGATASAGAHDATDPFLMVAVGSSTGGPQALAVFLKSLPAVLPYAVVIVQHMDASFLPGLAQWLTSQTGRAVTLARRGDRPMPGSILVAGEAMQMIMKPGGTLDYVTGDAELIHRPSVDVFFESLALIRSRTGAAVLLTGMGKDGATGMMSLRNSGWRTFAQDRATSVVWGMPGAASMSGAAERTLALEHIGPAVTAALFKPRPGVTT